MQALGLISDTHGLLREEAIEALRESDLIVHAGDIGSQEVITGLEAICPVIAIRGNVDRDAWADAYPHETTVEIEGHRIYVIHDLKAIPFDPAPAGYRVVISGHSHRPGISRDDDVLYLNPGSAGRRRFKLPVAVARLRISGAEISAEIVELQA